MRSNAVRRVRTVMNRFGMDMGRYPRWGTTEWTLGKLLPQLSVECVLDVGAHFGEYGRALRRLGYQGQIVSFEPVTESYERLREAASGDPKWHVEHCALGDSHAKMPIHVTEESDFSSLLVTETDNADHFADDIVVKRTENVVVHRLDSVIPNIDACRNASRVFLKTDTQGFDLKVIAGLGAQLARVEGIQIELPVVHLYQGMTDFTAAILELQNLGYELFGLSPVSHDSGFRTVEYDCIFRRVTQPIH